MAQTWTAGRLTATETGEIDLARAHLRALVTTARDLVATTGHDPSERACARAGCALATVEDGELLCGLAHRLALIEVDAPTAEAAGAHAWRHGDGTSGRAEPVGPRAAAAAIVAFRGALVASLDAVRACRSVGHPEGRCWFAGAAGDDGCGEVLRAAHLAG